MFRDFSDASKQKILGLVSEVENEKLCDLTDWIGDRWYDFDGWIGTLNIRSYINDVNSYHKKVIDKNNATKKTIETIFKNVSNINHTYSAIMSNVDINLGKMSSYIDAMNTIVTPSNGMFTSSAMSSRFDELLKEIEASKIQCLKDQMTQNVDETSDKEKTIWDKFVEEFQSQVGWSELLKGAGYVGTIYDFIYDIKNGKTWIDLLSKKRERYQFIKDAVRLFQNYKKIGNAVGRKKAMSWWLKCILGLKPVGRVSSAKKFTTRFLNNLTNKTSPFHAEWENNIKDFKGANGVKNAVAAWGAVAITGLTNLQSNIEEKKASNGEMSNARVIAETLSETAIDTALNYGADIVVGAAVSAILGPVPVAGVVVVAASGIIMGACNAGVKALTEKTTTEWVSDKILDLGEDIGKAVGDTAKNVSNSVGNWFQKLSFA